MELRTHSELAGESLLLLLDMARLECSLPNVNVGVRVIVDGAEAALAHTGTCSAGHMDYKPLHLCALVPLHPGIHRVEVRYRCARGEVLWPHDGDARSAGEQYVRWLAVY